MEYTYCILMVFLAVFLYDRLISKDKAKEFNKINLRHQQELLGMEIQYFSDLSAFYYQFRKERLFPGEFFDSEDIQRKISRLIEIYQMGKVFLERGRSSEDDQNILHSIDAQIELGQKVIDDLSEFDSGEIEYD